MGVFDGVLSFFDRDRPLRQAKRVSLGAGGVKQDNGWLGTDQDQIDLTERSTFARYWQPQSRIAFLAEHVWEHLTLDQAKVATSNCFEFLEPGGRLRLAVPDGLFPDPEYIEYVRPGGTGAGADDHKILWTRESLSAVLQASGFDVVPLEWWDEGGTFHAEPWSRDDGYIDRSKDFDPRNKDGQLKYTSLIIDGLKPGA